jgi:hypothetical protein
VNGGSVAKTWNEVKRLAEEFLHREIDLRVGPLFEVKLWRLSAHGYVLVMALDHLVSDMTSNAILASEIWTVYHHATRAAPWSLPSLPIQFADYAVWQQRTESAWRAKHEAHWRAHLAGAPAAQLAPDETPENDAPSDAATLNLRFGSTLSAKLREVARRERTLLPLVVFTVYLAVMSRWCHEEDLLVMFNSHGRHRRPELQNMIGLLANVLFFRVRVGAEDCLAGLLKRIALEFYSAHMHQDYDRVPDLLPECCSTKLYFNWLPASTGGRPVGCQNTSEGLKMRPFPIYAAWADDFIPFFSDTAAGIVSSVVFRRDRFAPSTIERFGGDLRRLAEAFESGPRTRLASI